MIYYQLKIKVFNDDLDHSILSDWAKFQLCFIKLMLLGRLNRIQTSVLSLDLLR